MASGVEVANEVLELFNKIKVRKTETPEQVKKRTKGVLFCLSDDEKRIIVDKKNQMLQGEIDEMVENPFTTFLQRLPATECRYGLYDVTYETEETKKEDLIFIMWAPEKAKLKDKMLFASSKDALKKKLTGIKHEWQVNGPEDISDLCVLADKLGQGSTVVTLEGKKL